MTFCVILGDELTQLTSVVQPQLYLKYSASTTHWQSHEVWWIIIQINYRNIKHKSNKYLKGGALAHNEVRIAWRSLSKFKNGFESSSWGGLPPLGYHTNGRAVRHPSVHAKYTSFLCSSLRPTALISGQESPKQSKDWIEDRFRFFLLTITLLIDGQLNICNEEPCRMPGFRR